MSTLLAQRTLAAEVERAWGALQPLSPVGGTAGNVSLLAAAPDGRMAGIFRAQTIPGDGNSFRMFGSVYSRATRTWSVPLRIDPAATLRVAADASVCRTSASTDLAAFCWIGSDANATGFSVSVYDWVSGTWDTTQLDVATPNTDISTVSGVIVHGRTVLALWFRLVSGVRRAQVARYVDGVWSAPEVIAMAPGSTAVAAVAPTMSVNSKGDVAMMWNETATSQKGVVVEGSIFGGPWTVTDLDPSGAHVFIGSGVSIAENGNLYVGVAGRLLPETHRRALLMSRIGGVWSPVDSRLHPGAPASDWRGPVPSGAVGLLRDDAGGGVAIAIFEGLVVATGASQSVVCVECDAAGTWGPFVNVSAVWNGTAAADRPYSQLRMDEFGGAYLQWAQSQNVYFSTRPPNGAWSAPLLLGVLWAVEPTGTHYLAVASADRSASMNLMQTNLTPGDQVSVRALEAVTS